MKSRSALLPLLLVVPLLAGCTTVDYYLQAIGGHMEIISKRRPLEEALTDPALSPDTRDKLEAVRGIRDFASRELLLPDNASYRSYADLQRPFVLWNVFAAPELSLAPKEWCFPIVGCVSYRGYFAHERALAFGEELQRESYDVYVGGVRAYSTLGWFDDPVLNTIVQRPTVEIAGIIFHELAHQRLYVRDDTEFNESFATAVELEGVRRWLAQQPAGGDYTEYRRRLERREQFVGLVMKAREQLEIVYRSSRDTDAKRSAKAEVFARMKREYVELKTGWGGYSAYDGWFAQDLNNAHIASVGAYRRYASAFEALLTTHGGDLAAFYRAAEELSRLPKPERQIALQALAEPARRGGMAPPSGAARVAAQQ